MCQFGEQAEKKPQKFAKINKKLQKMLISEHIFFTSFCRCECRSLSF